MLDVIKPCPNRDIPACAEIEIPEARYDSLGTRLPEPTGLSPRDPAAQLRSARLMVELGSISWIGGLRNGFQTDLAGQPLRIRNGGSGGLVLIESRSVRRAIFGPFSIGAAYLRTTAPFS